MAKPKLTVVPSPELEGGEVGIWTSEAWACRTLSITPSHLARLVRAGRLAAPTKNASGVFYDEDAVLALVGHVAYPTPKKKSRDEGELYAVLFAHFTNKTPFADIVIQEKVKPEIVRKAHEDFLSGWATPAVPVVDTKTRGKLEVLSRKERIKALEIELAETRGRNKMNVSTARSEAEKAKAHSQTMKSIMGIKT